ncbi:MAG: shikimate dehydrogenase, partial [Mucinivorans sp.]
MRHFGLLGYPLGHSFSKGFFSQACLYDNFEYRNVEDFIANIPPDLEGFNVTIPHKQNIIPYLDEIDPAAAQVGAVNCVKITPQRRLVGYNTDIVGFEESLSLMLCGQRPEALVLGSGGAAHAVWYVLRKMGIEFRTVSRSSPELNYLNLSGDTIAQSLLLVNTTPLGMVPQVDKKAD